MHQPLVNIAIKAARDAGRTILKYLNRLDGVSVSEKARNDFVTEVDQMAERDIVKAIHRAYPDHAILAEESGRSPGKSPVEWIVDPLDGTTNYLHGFPHCSVSIGIRERGRITHGVIYDPLKEELFVASAGRGALLNDRRLRVSNRKTLAGALLATGFPFRQRDLLEEYLKMFRDLFQQASDVRRAGSAALDLAYVAAGRVDGFWEMGLKPWDVAAGSLLVVEAGGSVSDFTGGHEYVERGDIVAAPVKIHPLVLETLRPHLPASLAAAGAPRAAR